MKHIQLACVRLRNENDLKIHFLSEAFRPSEESGRGERSAYSTINTQWYATKSRKSGSAQRFY